jgi:putative inorganic carbon (hco3(-)) transporter
MHHFHPRTILILLFHLLLLITPFLWTARTSELFEFPKMMFTYGTALLIVAAWASRMILEKRLIFRRTPFDIPLLLFLLSQIISTILSIDPHTSLWGYYSRFNGGLISTLTYITLFYALVSNFTPKDTLKLIYTLIATLFLTSLYSFPEHFGYSPSCYIITDQFNAQCWVQDVQTRVYGTFGQPNWQAAYIITVIFLPISLLISSLKTLKVTPKLLALSAMLLLPFSTLLFTKSRSGFLGFSLGLIIFTLLTLLKDKLKLKPLLIASCFLLITFYIFGQGIVPQIDRSIRMFATQQTSEQTTSTLPALEEIGGTESGEIRRIVWQGALDLFYQYPLFGSGVETFAYAYYNVRPVEHNLVSEWDFLYNKAHNEFLNLLATTGLFGFLSYTLIIFSFTLWTLKTISSKPYAHSPMPIALLSGYIALSISNFFGFSTLAVAQLFFLIPAISYTLTTKDSKTPPTSNPYALTPMLTAYLIPLLLISFPLIKLTTLYIADQAYAKGKSALESGDLQTSIILLQQATDNVPSQPVYTDQLSLAYAQGAISLAHANQATAASALAQQAIDYSDATLSKNNVHLNFYKTRARVFVALSQLEPSLIDQALNTLQASITLAPTDAKLWYNLGLLHFQLNNLDLAHELLEKTLELKPNYPAVQQTQSQIQEAKNDID